MSAAATYRTRYGRPLPVLKSRLSASGMWSKAVLSAPYPDLAGDVVDPAGLDFTLHKSDPAVDLEHGRDPSVRGMPVAWLRDTLSEPGGRYAVDMVRLNFGPDGGPEEWHTVPVGTNYFDKSCRVSSQVFALVEADALPAVSLEFRPVPGFLKSLGRSPLEPRDAYRFARAEVFGLAVCAKGVCPHALTVTKSAAVAEQVPPALGKILRDRRVNVGGSYEPLHPYILKALLPLAPQPTRTTARVEKAMDDEAQAQTAPDDMATTNEAALEPESGAGGPTPTAQAAYDLAQGARDLCDQIKAAAAKGEHKPGRKKLAALCEKLDAVSEMAMAVGKQVDADLSGGEPDGDEGDDEAPEPEVTDEDMEPDEDGVLKGIPPVFRKSVKRFTLADLSAAPVQKAPPAADPEDIAALRGELAALRREFKYVRK
jgi:hypothetical protein